ncbi:hypothetical protein BDW02DRAFT_602389 [Decorospora gaudefroyi]|uniref:Uncharacterized protein n=1 Tax=Decorospora gaudefroyi TaxID=184978 RepID=A0A6A5K0D6_9PLEO|nr:hypothetical protein BDW02DRAFT_602389 [Decorospora gaudefroyi]
MSSASSSAAAGSSSGAVKSYRVKFQRARPRITLLFACVAYLMTALLALSIGSLNVSNIIYLRFERAQVQYQAQSSTLYQEKLLYTQLDTLLSSQLNRAFMETHEDCLVRALRQANDELFDIGLRYRDIREPVMEWAMDNCGRLQYTPQLVHEEPNPQQAVLTYWADLNYRSRQMVEHALGFVKHKANWMWSRFCSESFTQTVPAHVLHASPGENPGKPTPHGKHLMQAPFGFALSCEQPQPCRLVYPVTSAMLYDKLGVSPQTIGKSERASKELEDFGLRLKKFRGAIDNSLAVLIPTQFFLALAFLVALAATVPLSDAVPEEQLTFASFIHEVMPKEERYAICSLGLETVTVLAFYILEEGSGLSWGEEFALTSGLIMMLLGFTMFVCFFLPSSELEDVVRFCALVKELYLIARDRALPSEKEDVDVTASADEGRRLHENTKSDTGEEVMKNTEVQSQLDVQRPFKQYYRLHHRLADPTTTVQEDMEAAPNAMHDEQAGQAKQATVDADVETEFDFDTDSDSDSDADQASFVDLASGVTPEITEIESGWSLVDA